MGLISKIPSQLSLRADIDIMVDTKHDYIGQVQPVSYIRQQAVDRTIYFIKVHNDFNTFFNQIFHVTNYLFILQAFQEDEEGECFLLRIHEKLPHKVKKGDKQDILEGFKKINSCRDEIEYFEPEPLVIRLFNAINDIS